MKLTKEERTKLKRLDEAARSWKRSIGIYRQAAIEALRDGRLNDAQKCVSQAMRAEARMESFNIAVHVLKGET